jgi:hypothetical protein
MPTAQPHDVAVIDAGVDAFDEAQVDDMLSARPEEYRGIQPVLQRVEGRSDERPVCAEMYTRVVAFGFKEGNLPDGDDPALLAVPEKDALGACSDGRIGRRTR